MPPQGVGVRGEEMAQAKHKALSLPPRQHSTNLGYKYSSGTAHPVTLRLITTIMMTATIPNS